MIDTDIIVILYGDTADYDRLIKSIEQTCKSYNIITIDNNKENLGFTAAVNQGIMQGTAPYIWLLNQDAIVLPGALDALQNRLKQNDRAGLVGSMQIDPENHDLIRFGGVLRAFPSGIHKGGQISMGHCRLPEKQTWVNFASVMLKREMIQRVGLLDEHMFLLYSDSDYCYTCRYHGYEAWYEPESQVYHRLNASKKTTEWHRKDMQAFMDKWNIILTGVSNGVPQFEYGRLFSQLDNHP